MPQGREQSRVEIPMIEIDGAFGEGGGQILRSSLSLSALTGQPMRITRIRARRAKPGLMPQHLKAVEAMAAITSARVEGAALGSQTLTFAPGPVQPGDYHFEIGTAGATSLVLQTVFLPLALAGAPSTVFIGGGTHVPWSPCFHYLQWQWLHYLRAIGLEAELELEKAGFYPRGGGRIHAAIHPARHLSPLRMVQRGNLRHVRGISAVARLPLRIAERQREQALQRLSVLPIPLEIENLELPAGSPGTLLLLLGEFEETRACFYSLGERGKRAEAVADEAADQLLGFLKTDGAVDPHLADQLVLPLALAAGTSELRVALTPHLRTNSELLRHFLPVRITIEGEPDRVGTVHIEGCGHSPAIA